MIDKNDISILLPVFDDTASLKLLLKDIEKLSDYVFQIIIIDDGSRLHPPKYEDFYDSLLTIKIVKLKENNGHQVAIYIGLRYIASHFPSTWRVIVSIFLHQFFSKIMLRIIVLINKKRAIEKILKFVESESVIRS